MTWLKRTSLGECCIFADKVSESDFRHDPFKSSFLIVIVGDAESLVVGVIGWLDISPFGKHHEVSENGDTCHPELSRDGVCVAEDGAEESIETTERMGKTRSVVSGLSWGSMRVDNVDISCRGSVKMRSDSGIANSC